MVAGLSQRRVMVVEAPDGMGKSWLLKIFAEQADADGLPHILIDFGDGRAYDTLSLVRYCREGLGAEHFTQLTNVIDAAATPRVEISVDAPPAPPGPATVNIENSTVSDSTINAISAGVLIQNSTFVPQVDAALARQALEDRVNTAFFDALSALSKTTTVVFLFDTYGRTSLEPDRWVPGEADRWVVGQLLERIRTGRLSNMVVVLAGQRTPVFGPEWNTILGRMDLHLLECKDVDEYLRQRLKLSDITDPEIDRLCQAVAGVPQIMGLIGDNLRRANQPVAVDEEW